MDGKLPQRIDAWRLAQGGGTLAGTIAPGALPRLQTLGELCEAVPAEVGFGVDETGRAVIRGEARARWRTVCQRCLEAVIIGVEARFEQALDELQAPAGPGEAAPLLNLFELIEDELILAAPMIPLHPEGECHPPGNQEPPAPPARRKPFAELGRLRKQKE